MANASRVVVVVDDDPEVLAAVSEVLALAGGYEVFRAADGLEALALLGRLVSRDPVVVSDVNMPRMDGVELMRAIRGEHDLSKVRIVILSGATVAASLFEADAVLTKPCEMRDLLATVGRYS